MLLFDIARLPVEAHSALLITLQEGRVQPGSDQRRGHLFDDIAASLRRLLDADEGALTQTMRGQLILLAGVLDPAPLAVSYPGNSTPLDLVSDAQLAWSISEWIFTAAENLLLTGDREVPEAMARRASSRQTSPMLDTRFSLQSSAASFNGRQESVVLGGPQRPREDRLKLLSAIQARPSEEPGDGMFLRGYDWGRWVCRLLCEARPMFEARDANRSPFIVVEAAQPAGDLLSAWLLTIATKDRGPDHPVPIRASSSRTRAQWTRTTRAIVAVSLTLWAYAERPLSLHEQSTTTEDAFSERADSGREATAG